MSEIHTYHTNLKATLLAAFPVLETVAVYRIGETLATPAVLVEVESMRIGELNGLGKTPVVLSVALHCVLGHATPHVELEVRNFAAQVLNLLRNQYFDMPDDVESPENLQALPGDFKPGKGGFESMVVTYEQTLYMGDPAFDLSYEGVSSEVNFAVVSEENASGQTVVLP